MQQMMVHCPLCQARLSISAKAGGKTARCPRCKKPFTVPTGKEIVEDTVACWLEIELEEEKRAEEERRLMSEVAPSNPLLYEEEELPALDPAELEDPAGAEPPAEPAPSEAAASKAGGGDGSADGRKIQPVLRSRRFDAEPDFLADFEEEILQDPPQTAAPQHAPQKEAGAEKSAADDPMALMQRRRAEALARAKHKPAGAGRTIHIKALEVLDSSVLIGFDADLLRRPAFRASMPLVCVGCGERPEGLIARPLVWADQSSDPNLTQERIESDHTVQVPADAAGRDVIGLLRDIEGLHEPFDRPMPYCVCPQCAPNVHLHCHTLPHEDELRCEVMVPNGRVALEWLGRVNGICGDDYADLEAALSQTRKVQPNEGWGALPERVRQRLSGWFQAAGGEQFIAYLKDADYPKADAGLGGFVITDKRLIYCKYHRHGAFRLNDDQTVIRVQREGPFDQFICERDGIATKFVRLRPDDTAQLVAGLKDLDAALRVETA